MKKDRNTFFQESQVFNQSGFPTMGVANQPFTTQSYSNQGFYAGPNPNTPMNYTTMNPQNQNYLNSDYSDLDSRLSKLERQINRLDARLSKLESNSIYTSSDTELNNNVYMV